MEINVWITDPNNKAAHRSLHNWLNNDPNIKEKGQLNLPASPPEGMGPELEVIQLILNSGFDLGKLALAFAEWRDKSREMAARIAVRSNERTTEISPEDMGDRDDRKYFVRRALAGAPDPRRSGCVLIGVSDYANLRELPGVRRNLEQLRAVLGDPEIFGTPSEKIRTIDYPESADAIRDAISAAAQDSPDTLLVYFAGHGLYDKDDGLLLALPDATGAKGVHTVPWRQLADVIRNANSRRRIVWLDCCYAGLALPDDESPPDLLRAAEVEGTYLLVAAQKYEEARSPDGEGCTAFTGELVEVLRNGIAPGPPTQEFLSLNSLHQHVRNALREKHLPEPNRDDPDKIGQLPHFHNNMTRERIGPQRPVARRPLPSLRLRNVVGISLALLVVLVGVLFAVRPWATSETSLGGLSLTDYCSALGAVEKHGFTVSGMDCTQTINLDEACAHEYSISGMKAVFGSADPNSAKCVDPKTNQTYNKGISNMAGYCQTLTAVAGVTATASNPNYMNTWICQIPINLDLACDAQKNQADLVARQVNGTWVCYKD